MLKHHIGEKGVTRENVLQMFLENLRKANANRRLDPEKFVKVRKIVRCKGGSGSFDIYYTVPSRYRKKKR